MKRFGWILVLLMAASPAWAAKNITVQQLTDLLTSLQQAKKTDAEVANELKQVALTEELTRATMNNLAGYLPGPYSTEQIYVLEARSAILPPPASDLPSTPAPDAAAVKAILDKAVDYATKTYQQLPSLTATRTQARLQDHMEAPAAMSGTNSGATTNASSDPNLVMAAQIVRYVKTTENTVTFKSGAEQNPLADDKTPWGANGFIALLANGPALGSVISEAQAAGKISFLRWETVNGKAAAVFAFSVDKKKSHYAVNYCCFPDVVPGPAQGGLSSTAAGYTPTAPSWHKYKATIPYHGEIFVDPDTGVVVRLITVAELKTSDEVRKEDQRIDYAPVTVGSKPLVLPARSYISTETAPSGDSQSAGKPINRHMMFTADYKNYEPAR